MLNLSFTLEFVASEQEILNLSKNYNYKNTEAAITIETEVEMIELESKSVIDYGPSFQHIRSVGATR